MKIKLCSYRYAASEFATGKYNALLTICDRGSQDWLGARKEVTPPSRSCLNLSFNDGPPFTNPWTFTPDDCLRLLRFATSLNNETSLLIQSAKGRSRGPAAAIITAVANGVPADAALAGVMSDSPKCKPSAWMLKMADALLDTGLFQLAVDRKLTKWTALLAQPSAS